MQPDVESLKFSVGLSGTYWDRQPEFTIWVDDKQYCKGVANSETQFHEFEVDATEGMSHTLRIRLENKTNADVIQNEDCTAILKDMLLNIDHISIDGFDLGEMLWSCGEFVGDDTNRPTLTGCVNLGWNGTYILEFSSPFYLWLLEKM